MKVRFTLELDLQNNTDSTRDPWPCDVSQFLYQLEDAIHEATYKNVPDQLTVESYNLKKVEPSK
ncbi:MAG: hypothetical protein ACKO0Z_06850 [Betaproteobacteria bacterium]